MILKDDRASLLRLTWTSRNARLARLLPSEGTCAIAATAALAAFTCVTMRR
jgi:hypothetical protein